ncbi:O-antigen polymerase [Marinobacter sp. LQ44]|uniref:O-antigen polymerase n=1 Tax=unclassified Marinobacter TaxID=83889 RepID=UPI00097826C1
MLYFLSFFLYSLRFVRDRPVAFYLLLFISFSIFSGLLVGNFLEIQGFLDLFNVLFTVFVLFVICSSFRGYSVVRVFDPLSSGSFKFLLYFVLIFSSFSFLINLLIVYKSFSYIVLSGADITEYKNEGEAAALIRQWVNPYLVRFANFASPLGVLSLAFHFYFLIRNRLTLSVLFLILSLNVPLAGLHGLSRAAIVQFVLMYLFFYLYAYSAIGSRIRNKINVFAFFVFGSIFFAFYFITNLRFSESSYYSAADDGFVRNRSLHSIFDYFSQWVGNSTEVMRNFTLDKLWYGKSSRSLFDEAFVRLGFDVNSYVDLRYQTLHGSASSFNGLVATLLYDFSYVGVLIFCFVFYFLVRCFSPKFGQVDFHRFICFGSLITVPALFFTNNYLSNVQFSLGVLYSFLAFWFLRFRFRSHSVSSN